MNEAQQKLFDEVQRLQEQNAKLHEKLASLKSQKSQIDSSPSDQTESYIDEVNSFKLQILKEEEEHKNLRLQLNCLFQTQDRMQAQIEEGNKTVLTVLNPALRCEEAKTKAFFDEVTKRCEQSDDPFAATLCSLIGLLLEKREELSKKREENQRLSRLITMNRANAPEAAEKSGAQESAPAQSNNASKPKETVQFGNVFDSPLPCMDVKSTFAFTRQEHRRVSFPCKK